MAVNPAGRNAIGQIGKYMEGRTAARLEKRLEPDREVKKQRVREQPRSRRAEEEAAAERARARRAERETGRNVDLRA